MKTYSNFYCRKAKSARRRGFGLLELLIVIAAISSVAAIGFVQLSNTTESVKLAKLRQDVTVLNKAVQTYAMSGGDLASVRSSEEIIGKLKSISSASQRTRIAGLRGSMVDLRLHGLSAIDDGAPRAVWNGEKKTFFVQKTGNGFREFVLLDAPAAAPVEEQRNLLMAMDNADKWVWSFSENGSAKSSPRTQSATNTLPVTPPDEAASMPVLLAPDFSKPGGTYKLSDYTPNLEVSFVERAATNLADIYYAIGNGPWNRWDGSSVPVKPDVTTEMRVYSEPLNPDKYEKSAVASALYATKSRLQPLLKFENLLSSYTYADVGGPFSAGLNPPPAPKTGPTVMLANPTEIPLSQQNSDSFQIRWNNDGSNLPASTTASVTGVFSNGFPGQQISVNYSQWGTSATLPLQVMSKALKLDDFRDSPILAPAITADRMQLPPPLIMETAPLNGVRQITIQADLATGLIPPGTRIYYTTNGDIPGVVRDSRGLDNATLSQLYTVPISLPADGDDMILTARLYPPVNLPQWFSASEIYFQEIPLGLGGGHIDVDTSSRLYPFRAGTTDGHVHAYDKKFNATGASFFNFASSNLRNVQNVVSAGSKFKIIVANANLSSGGRLIINKTYDPSNPGSWEKVKTYSNTAIHDLPVYSLEGLPGTTRLLDFGIYFDLTAITGGEIIPTSTGQVRSNTPGLNGEWRNGALTVQVVKVNDNGSDAFTTNTALSAGGKQGVATSGLLWETTIFHHSKAGAYAR